MPNRTRAYSLRAQRLRHGPQPVVTALTAAALRPDLPERHVQLVVHGDHVLQRHLEELRQLRHRRARQVHVRQRLDQHQLRTTEPQPALGHLGVRPLATGRTSRPPGTPAGRPPGSPRCAGCPRTPCPGCPGRPPARARHRCILLANEIRESADGTFPDRQLPDHGCGTSGSGFLGSLAVFGLCTVSASAASPVSPSSCSAVCASVTIASTKSGLDGQLGARRQGHVGRR